MSKARDLGNLLDTGGDVVSGSLDNVPTPSKTSIEALGIDVPAANLTGSIAEARIPSTALNSSVMTKSTSEPATDTNPSGGVGTVWLRTTTGEMYCCTDATTDANIWTNIGGGSGNISPSYAVDFLAIGGGAGSGYGGGGAGGYRNSFSTEASGGGASSQDSLALVPGTQYTITVGAGGAAGNVNTVNTASQGVDSTITGADITTITSHGGGFGGGYSSPTNTQGGDGASGGGSGPSSGTGGASDQSGEGYAGGGGIDTGPTHQAGGGGGASEVGTDGASGVAGDGGDGLSSSITGSAVTRAGGGGGGNHSGAGPGAAGAGGGGAGTTGGGTAGGVNLGGGAGGCTHNGFPGEAGGSGVVILRMLTADYSGTTTGSPTEDQSTVADTTILIFNGDGTYTA